MKFFDRIGDGPDAKYANTFAGALYLGSTSPRFIGGILIMLKRRLSKFLHDLPESRSTGKPQNEAMHGMKGMFLEIYEELPRGNSSWAP